MANRGTLTRILVIVGTVLVWVPVLAPVVLAFVIRKAQRSSGSTQAMRKFETKYLPATIDAVAPDGSDVRLLLSLSGGSMAHFELRPGRTSVAVTHRTVEEIWYFLSGRGEMWRKTGEQEETVDVTAGVCITIPLGTHFQFRALGSEPLAAIGVTLPPWPGEGEAMVVAGTWEPTVS